MDRVKLSSLYLEEVSGVQEQVRGSKVYSKVALISTIEFYSHDIQVSKKILFISQTDILKIMLLRGHFKET